MANIEMLRERNDSEKNLKSGGFRDLRSWRDTDFEQQAMILKTKVMQEFIYKKRLPFCNNCSTIAIQEKISEIEKEINKRKNIKARKIDIDIKIDFEKFGGLEMFQPVVDSFEDPIKQDVFLAGIKQNTITGVYRNYICKNCGNKHSIEFTNMEIDEMKKKEGAKK